jgi:hypothetical protein
MAAQLAASQEGLSFVSKQASKLSEITLSAADTFHNFIYDCSGAFLACSNCREAVKLCRFLTAPYSMIVTCSNV